MLIGFILAGSFLLIIYLLIVQNFTFGQLPEILGTLVNSFGLLLVSVALGFGLVSIPK